MSNKKEKKDVRKGKKEGEKNSVIKSGKKSASKRSVKEKKAKKKERKEAKKEEKGEKRKEEEVVSGGEEDKVIIEVEEGGQPVLNIGLVGHVDHGKTTLTEKLSGKWTDTHSEELKRGITIRLGYADTVFRKCPKCKGIEAYTVSKICAKHNVPTTFLRKVSFVDAPGHESLMATMLSGATIMDGALLLVAANEPCPQPQTREHLMALKIAGIKHLVVVQNKIDLVTKERAIRNYKEIKEFLKGTEYENAPIIPISAQHRVNIDALIKAIEETIPTPRRDPNANPLLLVARSFDINKPGVTPDKMRGGVLGGAIIRGKLRVGNRIEIRPGRVVEEQNKLVAKPIFTTIVSAMTGGVVVNELGPGGSVAIQTTLDPAVVHSDSLTGNLVGLPGRLPRVWYELNLDVHLLDRVVGSREELEVEPIKMSEVLLLNVNGEKSIGFVYELGKNSAKCRLKMPLCAEVGDKVTISRRIGTRFRLIGYAIIKE
ncbi:MAG TPA: translation initiation factor IF-2 subunit gamma [Candidatus Woesearchaeota archaeon]|nr:translation initiation factor IF-2 subunit gamma [Candidatus Woesearchaeota archaeon]